MILVLDIGNTNIVIGVYDEEKLLYHWRMSTDKEKTSDEFGMFIINLFRFENIDISSIEAVVIASVVPPIMYSIEHSIKKYFKLDPIIVTEKTKTGLKIMCENPKELGADRIVNSVAAYKLYGAPVIIVDFGTATTFCVLSKSGEYLGGAICPGIKISADALFMKASKLPKIELVKPDTVIGRNTITSMQSGLIYGYVGQVDYLINKIKKESNVESIKVIATGGLARLIASESKCIDIVDGFLTLEGLRLIYEMNKD